MDPRGRGDSGQATVELVLMLPFVALLAMTLWQATVAGQAAWLAGSAARAAARAHAIGVDPTAAAKAVVPEHLERGLKVRTRKDGSVGVTMPVPSVVGTGRLGTVDGQARLDRQHR